jgi:predicted phage-related endonuclease
VDDCPCIQNEDGLTIKFCRDCAAGLEQGSDEWRRAKIGKVSASRGADMIARTKSGWGASRANYRAELVCERLSGLPYEGYSNHYMDRGNQVEPEAVNAYEFSVGVEARTVGFVHHPTIADAGCSPDRLVATDGMLEAKCRTTAIHFDLLSTHSIPDKFIVQMQFGMACAEKEWCDFVSYDPRAPAGCDLFVKRIFRDRRRISELEQQTIEFLAEVEKQTAELRKRAAAGFIFIDAPEEDLAPVLEASIEMVGGKGK